MHPDSLSYSLFLSNTYYCVYDESVCVHATAHGGLRMTLELVLSCLHMGSGDGAQSSGLCAVSLHTHFFYFYLVCYFMKSWVSF